MTPSIYLAEATLEELLGEVQKRFTALNPVPAWAARTVFAVIAYYGISVELLRSKRRTDAVARVRHLTVAMLVKTNPVRTRHEVCEVVGLEHSMYYNALRRTEERIASFPDFQREVSEIVTIINETPAGNGHCRTSPQGTSGDLVANLSSTATGAPPARIAS